MKDRTASTPVIMKVYQVRLALMTWGNNWTRKVVVKEMNGTNEISDLSNFSTPFWISKKTNSSAAIYPALPGTDSRLPVNRANPTHDTSSGRT
ncbi:hypothetical protein D3C73_1511890 [compost metagenome]